MKVRIDEDYAMAIESMIDALRQWKHAERFDDKEEIENARKSRDLAIQNYESWGWE